MQATAELSTQTDGYIRKNVRRILTGISFLIFGLGSLDLAFVVLPLIIVCSTNSDIRRKRIQAIISWHFQLFIKLIQWLGLMKLNSRDIEKLQSDNGVIIIANHPTLIDVVVIISLLKKVDCVVKDGLNQNIFLRGVVRAAGYINNSDPEALLTGCEDSLRKGRNLIIFPEGTRSVSGKPLKFQRGVAHIALKAECKIRPIYLQCSPGTLSKNQNWYDVPERPFIFSFDVGDLIDTSEWIQEGAKGISTRQLTRQLEQHYQLKLADYLASE